MWAMPILLAEGIKEAESNHTTAFKASIQTIKCHNCTHSIVQSHMAMSDNEQRMPAPPTGSLYNHIVRRGCTIFLQGREQTDVIRNTIYPMAFFPQDHKMASVAPAILSQCRQKEIGRQRAVRSFPRNSRPVLFLAHQPELDHMNTHVWKVAKKMAVKLAIQRSQPHCPASK